MGDHEELITSGDQPSQQQRQSLQKWTAPSTPAAARLIPAPRDQIVRALSSALVLVAPAGFTEGDRKAWLTAAALTLQDVPADLLERGVAAARKVSDHPSKILPAIMGEISQAWRMRKEAVRSSHELLPPPADDFVPCTPEQAAQILAEFGLRRNPNA